MEARKITVVSTKTQKKSVIMSGAETLGELKKDFKDAGIDYEGMTFYEGTSKTELKTDESVLPKNVPYTNRTTGETINTNELVFMLTNTNKKIKSGAMNRAEVYSIIKARGLQEDCKTKFGKNFTQCSTHDLATLISESDAAATTHEEDCMDVQAREAIVTLIQALYEQDTIDGNVKDEILGCFTTKVPENYKSDSVSPYSDNEIDAMFRGMC